MRKRIAATYSTARGFYVDLPHYTMVAGTWEPIVKGIIHADGAFPGIDAADVLKHNPSVLCDLPDYVPFKNDGQIDSAALAKRYPRDSVHGEKSWRAPKVLGDR